MREIMALADRANQYIDQHKPWVLAKDPARAAEVQAVCTQGINLFRVLMMYLKPVLPKLAAAAEKFLGTAVAVLVGRRPAAARRPHPRLRAARDAGRPGGRQGAAGVGLGGEPEAVRASRRRRRGCSDRPRLPP